MPRLSGSGVRRAGRVHTKQCGSLAHSGQKKCFPAASATVYSPRIVLPQTEHSGSAVSKQRCEQYSLPAALRYLPASGLAQTEHFGSDFSQQLREQ